MKTFPEGNAEQVRRGKHRSIDFSDLARASADARSMQVVARAITRMALFCILAATASVGFGRMLTALLLMWTVICALIGLLGRERPLDAALTSWDEAAFYGLLFSMTAMVNEAAP